MFTDKEMIPVRKAIDAYALYFVLNNKWLLSILKAFAQWPSLCALLEMSDVFSVCVLAEQAVFRTSAFQYSRWSVPIFLPIDSSPPQRVRHAHHSQGLFCVLWSVYPHLKRWGKNDCSHWVVISGHWVPLTDRLPTIHPRTKIDRISGTLCSVANTRLSTKSRNQLSRSLMCHRQKP